MDTTHWREPVLADEAVHSGCLGLCGAGSRNTLTQTWRWLMRMRPSVGMTSYWFRGWITADTIRIRNATTMTTSSRIHSQLTMGMRGHRSHFPSLLCA